MQVRKIARMAASLRGCGFFHKGHPAIDDCHALLALLARPLKTSRRLTLTALVEAARRPTTPLWAKGSSI